MPSHSQSVTPRMVVPDVVGEVAFLQTVFGGTGDVEPGRPVEFRIGDSVVMISEVGERHPFPAFLYVYVDDADQAYQRALEAGAESLEPHPTCRTETGERWSGTTTATSSRSPTGSDRTELKPAS